MATIKTTHKIISYPIAILLICITASIVIQPFGSIFRYFTNHGVETMFAMLGIALVFMFLKWHQLMFTTFTCVGILCLFFKTSINPSPTYAAPTPAGKIEILHLNIDNYDWKSYEELSDLLLQSGADFISIQELTPDWDHFLQQQLQDSFPYNSSIASIGFNGLAIYSKIPIQDIETFYYKDIPNITGLLKAKELGKKAIRFISTYTNPPYDSEKFYTELKEHFTTIIKKIKNTSEAKLALGTYNIVPWSSEMKYFTNALGLYNSKRSTSPFSDGDYEHIFHSSSLECTRFNEIFSVDGSKVGMTVRMQFKSRTYGPQPTQ